ncbi:fimbrial protein [Pseudescherichia vulneris]|uniref:fimbrial protein n=1 Tax=Pseudescherichia vulneris TaxID=566 RepID=UPI00227C0A3C|nr:fimbrial protein [Pseudescherichia vulneris]WAH53750.1 fimbrial protein [Pseudescherichia vulneris]
MRILLALIAVFTVAQAQAHCFIAGNDKQFPYTADPVSIDLNAGDHNATENINFRDLQGIPSFVCIYGEQTPNHFNLLTSGTNDEYYLVKNGQHRLFVKVSIDSAENSTSADFPSDINHYYPAYELNNLQYKLKYSVQNNFTGTPTKTVNLNENFTLFNYIILKPADCSIKGCPAYNNSTHQYRYYIQMNFKFTPTTCTFKDQAITVQPISSQDLKNSDFIAPDTQPELQCSSTTGVATSNIKYHFEPVSTATNGILANELEVSSGSAGEVGFKLNNNGEDISFSPDQKFTVANFGEAVGDNSTFPLNLKVKYARYGNRVVAGNVQSKAKVVVDYD